MLHVTSQNGHQFITRRCASAACIMALCPSVRLQVILSVTSRCSVITAKHIIKEYLNLWDTAVSRYITTNLITIRITLYIIHKSANEQVMQTYLPKVTWYYFVSCIFRIYFKSILHNIAPEGRVFFFPLVLPRKYLFYVNAITQWSQKSQSLPVIIVLKYHNWKQNSRPGVLADNGTVVKITATQYNWLHYTVSKNDTALACYNFDVHQPILIICGRCVSRKASSQMLLYFLISPE